ncbi:NAD(P)/FAD-dependent oxidoreductase [Aggregicoccus sp. 17bor-14]|uniref:flavin-containing monooxygenase n=1 Tax=Myxococcaceae TaxID=31 RepID=UPI00129CF075|nr:MULTISPECIES: NAD(P)/FAD-dependent oxidoreductase [Myxococcaceae]MBF5046123.1 NAD(P)/FAD-dependent oxidoreductase [Simulacricoccus sp. 17bor-14]MRI91850.1 NAD(P)/FAD-dependent oxidoreductase [Aggregicoccus sp. 17bor-14]
MASDSSGSGEQVDVLIIGAGLSGIGAACHLQRQCPQKAYAILEARGAIGGTWDLFRYPGVRSDSDMFTLGYAFQPWEEAKAIADGPSILAYIRRTAEQYGVQKHIRFHHRLVRADWSSAESRWRVEVERTDTQERVQLSCSFLFGCTGYYRYDQGYAPRFEGSERFGGRIVHPQHWPEDLDYAGKRVVVIGSGATAVTLVPAMAEKAAHVTMLQRSPTYVLSLPAKDRLADLLRWLLPREAAYAAVRWKNVQVSRALFKLSRRAPGLMRALIRRGVQRRLPKGYAVDPHFQPTYDPWDQRLCLVPDGDLFQAIQAGRASVVTDGIAHFTERGLRLASGRELEADVVVTATGLNLLVFGGTSLAVDGQPVEVSKAVGYKGMMLGGVPNFAFALGYTNASWTLKVDLVSEYVCRLLNHMDAHGYTRCLPRAPEGALPEEPFIDLKSGYVLRSLAQLPRQGPRAPWRLNQDYPLDVALLRHGALEDEGMEFSRGPAAAAGAQRSG